MMFKRLSLPFLFALILLAAAVLPLLAADPPTVVPFGGAQSQPRAAYRALFEHTSQGGRAHWAQTAFGAGTLAFPAGTLYAPEGIAGGSYDRFLLSDTLTVRPALALDTQGTPVALFRSTLAGDYGTAAWELADVREALDVYLWGALRYDILDEEALAVADLSTYKILILPALRWGSEADALSLLDEDALANLQAFVRGGGFLYIQSNAALIAEAAGILPAGTTDLANPLQLAPGEPPNAGRLDLLDPTSPLALSWLTDTLYLLTDPVYHPPETMTVVAEYRNLEGGPQPAILTAEVGQGRVILVDGHPTAPSRRLQLPLFFDAILWATGRRAELFGDAAQTYNPNLDPHLLPAYEPGTPIRFRLTFNNVWDAPLYNVAITETVIGGLNVLSGTIFPAPAALLPQTHPTQTLVVWRFGVVPPGEVELGFTAQTGDEVLQKGELTVGTGRATYFTGQCPGGGTSCLPWGTLPLPGTVNLPADFRRETVRHRPFVLQSRMAARLMLDRDLEPDRHFSIPAEGADLDITVPIENKEDTLAGNLVITDVILLIAPIVDLEDQQTILGQNDGQTVWVRNEPFFYDETGGPYLPADGYAPGQSVTLADWEGDYAVFDVPGGVHYCGRGTVVLRSAGTGNCVTIPVTYSQYITVTADNRLLLPVKILTWRLGDFPGYHYEEPALRYGINSRELFGRRVTFDGSPGTTPEDVVIAGDGGSVYTHLGDYPIFYRDYLTQGTVYVPAAPLSSTITYLDIWSRTHRLSLRAAFYDVFDWASCGVCGYAGDRHAALNVTFGMRADVNGDGVRDEEVLLYPSRLDGADLNIVIKDRALLSDIPGDEMLIDMGVFRGLGVNIRPRYGDWAESWAANVPGTLSISPTLAYDRLYFQHDIPAGGTTVITLYARIDSYADLTREGMIKLHDGARFTYRQQAAGPSRYEVYDSHVQGVIGAAPELSLRKQGMPVQISTYGDDLYYIFTLDDPADPRLLQRNGPGDPFLQSYGFTNAVATLYIGGKEGRSILHSLVRRGEMTRLRIEINNNTGQPFTNVQVQPQPPAGIHVTRTYTDNVPPPIFFDLPFLYAETITDAGRGVYYFDLVVGDAYTGTWGEVITFPIVFSADGAPEGFRLPPVQLGLDGGGGAYRTYGRARRLVLTDSIPAYVTVLSAALVTADDVTALGDVAVNADRAPLFAAFTRTLPVTETAPGELTFGLPPDVQTRLYTPGEDVVYLAVKGTMTPPYPGPNLANYGATIIYRDEEGGLWRDASDPLTIEAGGAIIHTEYTCLSAEPPARGTPNLGEGGGDPTTCLLSAGEETPVTLRVTLYNAGDYVAQNLTTTLTLPEGISVTNTTPPAEVQGQTLLWRNLGDLAPGGLKEVEVEAIVSLNAAGQLARRAEPLFVPVIRRTDGQFVDAFTQRYIQAQVGGEYRLPVAGGVPSSVYLPFIFKDYTPAPDLLIADLRLTPASPVAGDPVTVTVRIANRGGLDITPDQTFWLDIYLDPNPAPTVAGQRWADLSEYGIGFEITDGLPAGGEKRLTFHGVYTYAQYANWPGFIPTPGDHTLYAFVDSWNGPTDADGLFTEADEANNIATLRFSVTGSPRGVALPEGALPPR